MALVVGMLLLSLLAGFSTSLMAQQARTAADSTLSAAGDVKKPSQLSLKDAVKAGYDPNDIPISQLIQLGSIVALSLLSLVAQFVIFLRTRASSEIVFKSSAVTLIITFAAASLIFGFNDQQIAPIIGLFGTIVGFLLGRSDRPTTATSGPVEPDKK